MDRVRLCAAITLVGLFGIGTACGGGAPPEQTNADGRTSKAGKAGKADVGEDEAPRPPMKAPRAPFLSLPDSAGEALAKEMFAKGESGALAASPQRGPFGPIESVTALWRVEVPSPSLVGGVFEGRASKLIGRLPIANDHALDGGVEIVWANSERGWTAVVLVRRLVDDKVEQQNQVFFWDGQVFQRDAAAEAKIGTFTSPDAIRQALL